MAVTKFTSTWNGIARSHGDYHVETCYGVYVDPDSAGIPCHLRLNGLSIYAGSQSDLEALLPAEVSVQINGGTVHRFHTDSVIRTNLYSPSGVLMRYASILSSQEEIALPQLAGTFTIHVTVATADEDSFSFSETGYRPVHRTMTVPVSMMTGSVYTFTLSSEVPAGGLFSNSAFLRCEPQVSRDATLSMLDVGYVDPYTMVSEASSAFQAIRFAVANPGIQSVTTCLANVSFQARYLSADFTDGIVITDILEQVPMTIQSSVDAGLKPVLTANLVGLSGTNAVTVSGHTAYVHRQSTLTLTPAAQFQYGDSLAYIRYDGKSSFSTSVTTQAAGTEPGTSYVRPDNSQTETAAEETVGSATVSVCGAKWGLESDDATKTYNVLWYATPRVNTFNLHRASRSSSSTAYSQGGYYYKKDDFGLYCIVEYDVSFSPLGGQNQKALILQYGATSVQINISSSQSGYYVFYAGTSAMNVLLELTDNFYPYGVVATLRLSTAGILIDYLAGGKGMAIGKTAEEQMALDISRDWRLLFYNADIGAYNSNTSSEDLVAWMHSVDARLTALENV